MSPIELKLINIIKSLGRANGRPAFENHRGQILSGIAILSHIFGAIDHINGAATMIISKIRTTMRTISDPTSPSAAGVTGGGLEFIIGTEKSPISVFAFLFSMLED